MSLDIIIINYNSTDLLLRCLESVYDHIKKISLNVYVQDNHSRDGIDRVSLLFPQVVLTKNSYNMGFARAVNRGLEQGSAPHILILNPDSVLRDGSFGSLLQYMEQNPDVGIVGPRILNDDGSVQGSARTFPTPFSALFGRNTFLTKWFPKNPMSRKNVVTSRGEGTAPMEVEWVSGACMLAKRKALDDVGPLDEHFFMYWEDADWCKRMGKLGWKVVYFPKASIVHYVGGSSEKLVIRSVLEFHKSSYYLFRKHSNSRFHYLMPLVLSALGLRAVLVLASQGIRRMLRRPRGPMNSGKSSCPNGGRITAEKNLRTVKSPRNEFQDRNYLHCR
jgi:GT2 family glycosyltransferase